MAHFSIQKKRDQYRKQGIFHTNKDLAQKVKERLEQYTDQPITEIVDLCVGGGGLLEPFSDDVAKFGCDIESEFVEYTRENQKGDFRVASIFTEPFGDKKFTHIVGNYPFSIKGNGQEMTSKYGGIYPYQLANTLDSSFVLAKGDSYCLSVSTLAMKPPEQEHKSEAEIELEFNTNAREMLESGLKNISTTIKMYKLMSSLDIRQTAYYREYLERANVIITEALKDLRG